MSARGGDKPEADKSGQAWGGRKTGIFSERMTKYIGVLIGRVRN